jgi:hypothetical protein
MVKSLKMGSLSTVSPTRLEILDAPGYDTALKLNTVGFVTEERHGERSWGI